MQNVSQYSLKVAPKVTKNHETAFSLVPGGDIAYNLLIDREISADGYAWAAVGFIPWAKTGKIVGNGIVKGSITALRQVGKYLESVDDVFANPNLLKGQSPAQVSGLLGKTPGWKVETLGRGAHKGQGMILREYGSKGPTGRMIQWHPGGGHHGSNPYWKVSSGAGTYRIF